MKRNKLLLSKGYNLTKIQNELFRQLNEYINNKGITRTQFAEELGVSKGYVSQVLNGEFDFKLSKLVELSIAIGKVPEIKFKSIEEINKNSRSSEVSLPEWVFSEGSEGGDLEIHPHRRGTYYSKSQGIEINEEDSIYTNSLMN